MNTSTHAGAISTRFGSPSRASVGCLVASAAVLLAQPAWPQLGSGWTEDTPERRLQLRGCGAHSESAGIETFELTCSSSGGDQRAERRIENDYSSGKRQFEGEFRVVSLGGRNVSVKQTFMPNNGAFLMIAVGNDGRLYSVGDGNDLASDIIGQWVRLNTIHDVEAGTHEIYVNGELQYTKTGGRQVDWHDKYGSYRLGSGQGPIVVEWRNVSFWTDEGGAMPPDPDAGAPEPPDAGDPSPPDASPMAPASGGAGGVSSAGAGGGTGVIGGTGGTTNAAGGSITDPGTTPDNTNAVPAAGAGCTLAGPAQHSPAQGRAPTWALLLVLLAWTRKRFAHRRR